VLSHFGWQGDERVLDVGSGSGSYYLPMQNTLPPHRYFAVDTSPGMLTRHPARQCATLADAQSLPFPTGSFDVVMANHMLFHVHDIDAALKEFQRVLKPEGVVIAATSSILTMPEFQALYRRALVLLGVSGKAFSNVPVPAHFPFSLENGTRRLAQHFYAVVRYDLPGTLVFSSADPVMQYLQSGRDLYEPQLPPRVAWDDLMAVMRDQINALVGHFGELVINKVSGVLVASDRGGFVRDFVERRNGSGR
jgi:SAM-dependent methyltransferase